MIVIVIIKDNVMMTVMTSSKTESYLHQSVIAASIINVLKLP